MASRTATKARRGQGVVLLPVASCCGHDPSYRRSTVVRESWAQGHLGTMASRLSPVGCPGGHQPAPLPYQPKTNGHFGKACIAWVRSVVAVVACIPPSRAVRRHIVLGSGALVSMIVALQGACHVKVQGGKRGRGERKRRTVMTQSSPPPISSDGET